MKRLDEEQERRERKHEFNANEFNAADTAKAWSQFLANRKAPSMPLTGVRKMIYESWIRSNTTGIRASQFAAPSLDSTDLTEKKLFYQAEMRKATLNCFQNMSDMIAGAEAMLILTDQDGAILKTVGDNSTLRRAARINLDVGGVWSEAASGTNGIGTALWMGKPVYVHGEEHFCEGMKEWSCAAAPIRDPFDQSIIGAINLSGLTSIFQKHNAAFAASLARDIEITLQQSLSQTNFKLLEWVVGSKTRRGFAGCDGLAIIDRFGRLIFDRFSHNRNTSSEMVEKLGKPFLEFSGGISEKAIIAALPSKFICKDLQLIEIDGAIKGASLVLEDDSGSQPRNQTARRYPIPGIEIGNSGLKIVGRSEVILTALEIASSLMDTNAPTLIQGETGVGKQLFARLIHAGNEPFQSQPFSPINCAALTREVLENRLTQPDAIDLDGSMPMSGNDSELLVLDELGELPAELQPVLLRLLESATVGNHNEPSGGSPARILSLTNRHLMDEVATDGFRRDLFYRLGAVTLEVPPLRDRGEDILLIFEHYNRLLAAQSKRESLVLGIDVEEALLAHDWPGNVRELCNAVSSLHYKPKAGRIEVSDLPFNQVGRKSFLLTSQAKGPPSTMINLESLKDSEISVIERALTSNHGNLSKTAIALGVSRPTLYRKMELYNICIVGGKLRPK